MEKIYELVQDQFTSMYSTGKLFRSSIPGSDLWDKYLQGFSDQKIFRDPESSEHNCNTCQSFFKRYANIVAISGDLTIMSLFDLYDYVPDEYRNSFKILSDLLKNSPIKDTFIETVPNLQKLSYGPSKPNQEAYRLGISENIKVYTQEEADKFGVVTPGVAYKFEHYHLTIPGSFITNSQESVEALSAHTRTSKELLKRALDEITIDTFELVRDLINQGSLLDGATHLHKVEAMIPLAKEYEELSKKEKDNWCWIKSCGFNYSRFRNELIGVLCTELAQGKELNKACEDWNKRVDPANYMKASAPITQRQINEAMKFAQENGYEGSFIRRCAVLEDIKVCDILHANSGSGEIKAVSVFDSIKPTSTRHKRSEFDGIQEVPIEKFMRDILPGCQSVEAYLTSSHKGNFVTLTTPVDQETKPIFKWNNNFSWTYNGNLAGKSQLRDAVIKAGGRVGVIRFSHSWNELERNESLMDAHVFMPGDHYGNANASLDRDGTHDYYPQGQRVGWNHRNDAPSGGVQDVDYVDQAPRDYIPVENITFPDITRMPEGKYYYKIHNWSYRKTSGKGKAEIEFDGQIYQYVYPALKHKEWCTVAVVTLKNGQFSIEHKLPLANFDEKEETIYGLDTNKFHKVNLICLSPNHWGSNIGNKHYFFMLDGCTAPDRIRGFHNENLIPELLQHRKVMEVLGAKLMVDSIPGQLSGLGFNATVKDSLIVRLKGSHSRVIKILF